MYPQAHGKILNLLSDIVFVRLSVVYFIKCISGSHFVKTYNFSRSRGDSYFSPVSKEYMEKFVSIVRFLK